MYIQRELEKEILPFLDRKEALVILGPRQAGKTTLLKNLERILTERGRRVKFMTFESQADLTLFNTDIESFKAIISQYECVIIDEFQYATAGGQKLKYLYDTTPTKFILSGSSSLELVFQTGKYMVGRLMEFTLLPFSFQEFISFREKELHALLEAEPVHTLFSQASGKVFGKEVQRRLTVLLEEYVVFGGYPAVVLAGNKEEKVKILESIAGNYFLRDIESLLHLATSGELRLLQKLLAAQVGNMIKYQELSLASGLPHRDLKRHLDILEKTYAVSFIRPFFTNRRTELTKNPKVYFLDLGFRNFVLSDFRPLVDRPDVGALMENYAYTLLRHRLPGTTDIHYWRTKSKAEVDFVIEMDGKIRPFEIKYVSKRVKGKSLYSFMEKFRPVEVTILTKDFVHEEKSDDGSVRFVPLSYF